MGPNNVLTETFLTETFLTESFDRNVLVFFELLFFFWAGGGGGCLWGGDLEGRLGGGVEGGKAGAGGLSKLSSNWPNRASFCLDKEIKNDTTIQFLSILS